MCRDNTKNEPRYVAFDVRPGGTNRMEIRAADGCLYLQRITFREVKPPKKLVFTWAWERFSPAGEKQEESPETLVTVEFFQRENSTEVVLTHEGFPNAKLRDATSMGWNGSFDLLQKVL